MTIDKIVITAAEIHPIDNTSFLFYSAFNNRVQRYTPTQAAYDKIHFVIYVKTRLGNQAYFSGRLDYNESARANYRMLETHVLRDLKYKLRTGKMTEKEFQQAIKDLDLEFLVKLSQMKTRPQEKPKNE